MSTKKRALKSVPEEVKLDWAAKDVPSLRGALVYADNSVDSVSLVHVIQFLTPDERIDLMNELYRIMRVGAKCVIISPHWSCQRAYADMRLQWPPVAEGWLAYLNAGTRTADPWIDARYKCDFEATWGESLHPVVAARNSEYQQHAVQFFKEAVQDIAATLIKK